MGRTVAIVDRWTIEHKLGRTLRLMPIVPRAPRTFTAVWRRANPRGLAVKELLETITTIATQHVATHRRRAQR